MESICFDSWIESNKCIKFIIIIEFVKTSYWLSWNYQIQLEYDASQIHHQANDFNHFKIAVNFKTFQNKLKWKSFMTSSFEKFQTETYILISFILVYREINNLCSNICATYVLSLSLLFSKLTNFHTSYKRWLE